MSEQYLRYELVLATDDKQWNVAAFEVRGAIDEPVREMERCGQVLAAELRTKWGGLRTEDKAPKRKKR